MSKHKRSGTKVKIKWIGIDEQPVPGNTGFGNRFVRSKGKRSQTKGEVKWFDADEKLVSRMQRVTGGANLVAHVGRGKKILPNPRFAAKVVAKSASKNQVRALVNDYQKAGYGISGLTNDGVVIVSPSGRPDSFNLSQLDEAFSEVKIRG